jgi:Tat protein translocase TatB subunit
MFNVGPGEALAILVIALIVLGPEKLPEVIRTVGRVMGELRRMSNSFQNELRNAVDDPAFDDKAKTTHRSPGRERPRRNGAVASAPTHTSAEPDDRATDDADEPSDQPKSDATDIDEAH